MFERVSAFVEDLGAVSTASDLAAALESISSHLGFSYFAVAHHLDLPHGAQPPVRIHNYPASWERYFDGQQLGRNDPVRRACQMTAVGFAWSRLPAMIQLTKRDRDVLDEAARHGIGEGFTVPAHVPGEVNGSCSFATAHGAPLPAQHLTTAQLVGGFAFEALRRLARSPERPPPAPRHVSDRERDCLIWVARGKSDFEIATILGISPETVHQYVKHARATHDVVSRSQLVAHALFSGTISYLEIFKR